MPTRKQWLHYSQAKQHCTCINWIIIVIFMLLIFSWFLNFIEIKFESHKSFYALILLCYFLITIELFTKFSSVFARIKKKLNKQIYLNTKSVYDNFIKRGNVPHWYDRAHWQVLYISPKILATTLNLILYFPKLWSISTQLVHLQRFRIITRY